MLSSLDDPVRRRLYEFVSRSVQPVGRDEAAAAGRHRPAAGRLSPGQAGRTRPAHRLLPAARGPGRSRGLAARPRCTPVPEASSRSPCHRVNTNWRPACSRWRSNPTGAARAGPRCVTRPAVRRRSRLSAAGPPIPPGREPGRPLKDALRGHGFEPFQDEDGTIRLRNCPFHQLAARHRDVVCGMNLALIEGLVAGLRATGLQPALHPQPGQLLRGDRGQRSIRRCGPGGTAMTQELALEPR